MATAVVMPKQGNTVESCILVEWKKSVGDAIAEGEAIADVETDKAVMEVVSPAAGTVLALFFEPGDDVPVMTSIAAVGEPGEDAGGLRPDGATAGAPVQAAEAAPTTPAQPAPAPATQAAAPAVPAPAGEGASPVSPRARHLAERKGVEAAALAGTGPAGRVIERDVQAALAAQPKLTPVAQAMVAAGYSAPQKGSGPGGRVMARDLQAASAAPAAPAPAVPAPATGAGAEDEVQVIPVKGVRKLIAERMLASLQITAQLTLNSSADARALLALRKRFKESPKELGLRGVTINDLLLFAAARALLRHPDLNAVFENNEVRQHRRVHLGVAVDTPRGLVVPVLRAADTLPLRTLSAETKRLAAAAMDGKINPDELAGGTFTVTNLGSLGIESFTPILNPPQVAILGVGGVRLKAVEVGEKVRHIPHLGLSLTINHQVVDGAPGARFLQTLAGYLAEIDLLLAL